MALTNKVNQVSNAPSPEARGQGPVTAIEKAAGELSTAANSPDYKNGSSPPSATRAGLTEFLARRQAAVLEVLAEFTEHSSLSAALFAVVNDLQHRFQCERVTLGLLVGSRIHIRAISQQAVIELRSNEVRLISDAMLEACDQQCAVHFPDLQELLLETDAHQTLSLEHGKAQVYTIPLCHDEKIVGALQLQRSSDQIWSPLTLELIAQITLLLAPLIEFRGNAERSILNTIRARARDKLDWLRKPRHLVFKAGLVFFLLLLGLAYGFPVTHTIKATAELVPTERRVISAPNNGFITSVFANAGDQVGAGDVLLQLETRELELQKTAQENELLGMQAELRSAMASYDRKEVAIAQARVSQIEAELALTNQHISRSTITAPVAGVIVSGDMSQTLGMTVERGKMLMELSPADGYEVQLLVHEIDVPYLQVGQPGRLSLTSDPGKELPVEVSVIHPIAMASGGASRFLIETTLQQQSSGLRPGQTGMVKLDVGDATLLWVWTHRFMEWSRQRLWEWLG